MKWVSSSNRIMRVIAMTDGATITPDGDASDIATVTLGGNRTMAAPTGTPLDGQPLTFRIKQDATGSRTLTWNSIYTFPGGTAPILSTTANATDILGFQYNAATSKFECLSMQLYDSAFTAASQSYVQSYVAGLTPPVFVGRATSNVTLGSSGTLFPVPLDTEDCDTLNGHSTVTNNSRYSPTVAGYYMVIGNLFWNSATDTSFRKVILRMNGSTTIPGTQALMRCPAGSMLFSQPAPIGLTYFNGSTDYVELCADSGISSSILFANSTDGPSLVCARVR